MLVSAVALTATGFPAAAVAPASEPSVRYLVRYAADADVATETAAIRSRGLGVGRTFFGRGT